MTDLFTRLLSEDPLEPGSESEAHPSEPGSEPEPESDTGWLILYRRSYTQHQLPPIGVRPYVTLDGQPRHFASRTEAYEWADRHIPRRDRYTIAPYPRRWARIYRDGPIMTGVQFSFRTYRDAADSGEPPIIVPVYAGTDGSIETYARVRQFLRTGELSFMPLDPATYLPTDVPEGTDIALHPDVQALYREVDSYWESLTQERVSRPDASVTVDPPTSEASRPEERSAQPWREIIPFLRGWASMIQGVIVENTTLTADTATITLLSVYSPEPNRNRNRVVVTVRSTEPSVSLAFNEGDTSLDAILLRGRFMECIANAASLLEVHFAALLFDSHPQT